MRDQGVAPGLRASAAEPHRPIMRNSSVASLSLALARSTNMDRRLTMGATESRLQIRSTSSALRLRAMKLACTRPLALQ